jgi:hypothetical protein
VVVASDIPTHALPQRRFKVLPFSPVLSLRFNFFASRPHSTLTWIGNSLISEQRYVAHHRFLLTPLLQSLFSQQPGLRLQQYKVLRIILRSLRSPGTDFRLSIGFALQAIPKVA